MVPSGRRALQRRLLRRLFRETSNEDGRDNQLPRFCSSKLPLEHERANEGWQFRKRGRDFSVSRCAAVASLGHVRTIISDVSFAQRSQARGYSEDSKDLFILIVL